VHRLVQAVVRDSLRDDLKQRWLGAAVRTLRGALSPITQTRPPAIR
jgi:hypothetical protein